MDQPDPNADKKPEVARHEPQPEPEHVPLPVNLLPSTIERQTVRINHWFLETMPGITADHVVSPDFWVHVARRVRVNDRIEVVAKDGSFDLDLRVVAIDPRGFWVQVRPLRVFNGHPIVIERGDPDGYKIEHDPVHKWRIIDRAGNVVDKGLADERHAIARLAKIKAEKNARN